MAVQTCDVIYQSALTGEVGQASGTHWTYLATACTPSFTTYFWSQLKAAGAEILFARALIAWNPDTDASPTGLRLISADDGPANLIEIHRWLESNYHTPKVDAFDMTTTMQAMLAAGIYKHIGFQTIGNGANGPIIYEVRLEIIWR
jgi:hypothetical protein